VPGVRIGRALEAGVQLLIGKGGKGANRLAGCRIDAGDCHALQHFRLNGEFGEPLIGNAGAAAKYGVPTITPANRLASMIGLNAPTF
jgi:hypothetical protein